MQFPLSAQLPQPRSMNSSMSRSPPHPDRQRTKFWMPSQTLSTMNIPAAASNTRSNARNKLIPPPLWGRLVTCGGLVIRLPGSVPIYRTSDNVFPTVLS